MADRPSNARRLIGGVRSALARVGSQLLHAVKKNIVPKGKEKADKPGAAWVRAYRAWFRGNQGYYATEYQRVKSGKRCGPALRRLKAQIRSVEGVA